MTRKQAGTLAKSKHNGMKNRSATKVDSGLGERIRLRRTELGLSQSELGDQLGVSFQQVQKYEKGTNRVSAARLTQMATILQVPITFFYDAQTKLEREVQSLLFIDSHFSIKLLRAYAAIKDVRVQRQFVALLESISGETEDV